MIRAIVLVALLAGTARADTEHAYGDVHIGVSTTGELGVPLHEPQRSAFHIDTLRVAAAVVADEPLGGTPWRLGGVARLSTEPSAALGASLTYDLGCDRLIRAQLGTFTCPGCRGGTDPRAFVRGELDWGPLVVSVEGRAVAFDFASTVRPLGTRSELFIGAGLRDWRGALVLIALEAAVYAYVETHPPHEND